MKPEVRNLKGRELQAASKNYNNHSHFMNQIRRMKLRRSYPLIAKRLISGIQLRQELPEKHRRLLTEPGNTNTHASINRRPRCGLAYVKNTDSRWTIDEIWKSGRSKNMKPGVRNLKGCELRAASKNYNNHSHFTNQIRRMKLRRSYPLIAKQLISGIQLRQELPEKHRRLCRSLETQIRMHLSTGGHDVAWLMSRTLTHDGRLTKSGSPEEART